MTDMEKHADAVVHAVVAVELLHWHGKLAGSLESAFRRSVYTPVLPRLQRLTSRALSWDDLKMDKDGRKLSRPSRVHDAVLEKQFTLGFAFTTEALKALQIDNDRIWKPMAQYRSRQELLLAGLAVEEDPQAKELVAWCQGTASHSGKEGKPLTVLDRAVGHGEGGQNIWILPVFVDHDRSSHAERQAVLLMLEDLPMDVREEGVRRDVTGRFRVYATHVPCISCLSSMCQLTRAFEGAGLQVSFDTWKETRRWISNSTNSTTGFGRRGFVEEEAAAEGGEGAVRKTPQ